MQDNTFFSNALIAALLIKIRSVVYNNVVLFLYSNVLHSHGMARLLNCLVSGFDSLMDILPFPQLSVGLTSFSSYSVTMPFIYNLVYLDQFTGKTCVLLQFHFYLTL